MNYACLFVTSGRYGGELLANQALTVVSVSLVALILESNCLDEVRHTSANRLVGPVLDIGTVARHSPSATWL